MKEATGELNMTVVTVVAVAALLAFFYIVIWPNLQSGLALSSACSAAQGGEYKVTNKDGSSIFCAKSADPADQVCSYTDKNGKSSQKQCSNSGN